MEIMRSELVAQVELLLGKDALCIVCIERIVKSHMVGLARICNVHYLILDFILASSKRMATMNLFFNLLY